MPLRDPSTHPILREARPAHPFWTLQPRLFFGQIPASTEPTKDKDATIRASLVSIRARAICLVPIGPACPFLWTSLLSQSWKNSSLTGKKEDNTHHFLTKPDYVFAG